MYGYVEHFSRSISLCRGLLSKTDKLNEFDDILKKNGFTSLTTHSVPLTYNLDELETELEWLHDFLSNVIKTNKQYKKFQHKLNIKPRNNRGSIRSSGSSAGDSSVPSSSETSVNTTTTNSQDTANETPATTPATSPTASQPQDTWCVCRGPSKGVMIACENEKCPIEWFHVDCINIKSRELNRKWWCENCR